MDPHFGTIFNHWPMPAWHPNIAVKEYLHVSPSSRAQRIRCPSL